MTEKTALSIAIGLLEVEKNVSTTQTSRSQFQEAELVLRRILGQKVECECGSEEEGDPVVVMCRNCGGERK